MKRIVQYLRLSRRAQFYLRRLRRKIWQGVRWGLILYMAVILAGLIPVNRGFQPAQDGVAITFVASAIHADIILPLQTETIDWRSQFAASQFQDDVTDATYIAVGWGDRDFFTQTRAFANLRVSKLLKALFLPTRSCLHVSFIHANPGQKNARTVMISRPQYQRLVTYIRSSFQLNPEGRPIQIKNAAYGSNDAFFEAHGWYHGFNTCNSWVGQAMQKAGIRTGWYTPLPKTMLFYV